ncbi:MAG TPA: hypothetical protein VGN14_08075 [Candidatus Elarobacter sp.]
MIGRRWTATAFAAGAFLAACAAASAATTLIAADPDHPSALAFAGGEITMIKREEPHFDYRASICTAFVNTAAQPVTRFTGTFAMLDASGTVVRVETFGGGGTFAPGQRFAISEGGERPFNSLYGANGNCKLFELHRTLYSAMMLDLVKGTPLTPTPAVLVSMREIGYADGTTWRAPQVPQIGDHAQVPVPSYDFVTTGWPAVDARADASSPVELSDPFAYVDAVFAAGRLLFIGPKLCVSFVNHDARPIKRIHFVAALDDTSGATIVRQPFETVGTFEKGVLYRDGRLGPMSCTGEQNLGKRSDTLVAVPTPRGAEVPIGRVRIMPVAVDFADGTSWTLPNG